jgi:hypothetical protein
MSHPQKECTCTPLQVQRHRSKVSGSRRLDRIDIQIEAQGLRSGSCFGTNSVGKPVWSRKQQLLMSCLGVNNFNTKSQPPGFGSTGGAYLQIDDITIGAVYGSFHSHTSLAVHGFSPSMR